MGVIHQRLQCVLSYNMLYWEAIRFAIGKGFRKLDFGRSTPHEGTYNLNVNHI